MTSVRLLPLLALAALPVMLAGQTVPTTINYQGRLTDNTPSQTPINATVQMQFAIYDAASGGTRLWQEPATNNTGTPVTVTGGIFSYVLGNAVALPSSVFTGTTSVRYLQVTLNPAGSAEILVPRQLVTAIGYAHLAQNAGSATVFSGALAGDVAGSQSATTVAGLRGRTVAATAPTANQVLQYSGSQWQPASLGSIVETDPKVGTLSDGRVPRWNDTGYLENGSFLETPGLVTLSGASLNIASPGTLSIGVRYVNCPVTTPVQNCSCAAVETVVSGGGYRASGGDIIRSSYPVSTTTWQIICTNSAGNDVNCGGMAIICDRRKP